MNRSLVPLALSATMTISPLADACYSCAGWGNVWGKRLSMCASSDKMLEALIACDRVKCETECAAYIDSYDKCATSGDPACVVSGATADCDYCQAGAGPWYGIGCNTELVACSYDRTGCTSCNDWMFASGDIDNLCYPEAITASVDVSACACSGTCAAKCFSACAEGAPGFYYLVPDSAGFACGACLGSACGAQFNSCSAM